MLNFSKEPISVINNIPRFIELDSDYTGNFGFQWNKFQKTQLDSYIDQNFSKDRIEKSTQWDFSSLKGKNILEAGSGAGRFTEVLLNNTEADIHSFDYSNAVDANAKNNAPNNRLKLFQASIYDIPFPEFSFDKVICIGVLQHTPDFKQSIECLAKMVKPGGELVIDFYPINGWWTKLNAKYLLRPLTKKWTNERLLTTIEDNIDWMISTSSFLSGIGLNVLNRFIPIVDIKNTFPASLNKDKLREMAILDTFDMFSPEFDNPQRISTVQKWVKETGLELVENPNGKANTSSVIRAVRS